jgi:type IV pilus assembly protein PilO
MTGNLRKVIFFILLLTVAYLAYAFMIQPANKSLADQRERVQQDIKTLNELQQATATARDLNKQLVQLGEAINFFESKLPPHSQISQVLQDVTVIAQKQGLATKSIKTLNRKDNSGYIEQPLQMELYGSFNAYYSFLLELEKLPRITKIRELQLKRDPSNDGAATANCIMSIFFQNDKAG